MSEFLDEFGKITRVEFFNENNSSIVVPISVFESNLEQVGNKFFLEGFEAGLKDKKKISFLYESPPALLVIMVFISVCLFCGEYVRVKKELDNAKFDLEISRSETVSWKEAFKKELGHPK